MDLTIAAEKLKQNVIPDIRKETLNKMKKSQEYGDRGHNDYVSRYEKNTGRLINFTSNR